MELLELKLYLHKTEGEKEQDFGFSLGGGLNPRENSCWQHYQGSVRQKVYDLKIISEGGL